MTTMFIMAARVVQIRIQDMCGMQPETTPAADVKQKSTKRYYQAGSACDRKGWRFRVINVKCLSVSDPHP